MSPVRDLITVNVNMFSGDILLTCTYAPDVNPEAYSRLSAGRSIYSYCPELHHLDKLGFKMCTIFRLDRVSSVTVLTKDGSPHSMQIPLMVQEAAEDVGFEKSCISYFCLEGGELHEISDLTVRKARHYSEIEALLPFAQIDRVAEVLRGEDGCPNDRAETFETVVDHLREEVEEIAAAIESGDGANLIEEIGDVMFNLVLLGRILKEQGQGSLSDVARLAARKMVDRHPKVFESRTLKY
ncbi:MazG nucleotide pyrophosphohydrolase domain-containing protein [Streptosporangium sp. CA-135522]|uniref:MazG nucleotide pyrophosphohydrolase domain-containing protein n=1 Tax=Streptosporangium sp. CA-135522 TaxID=3240072 RepID=UPI003D9085B1